MLTDTDTDTLTPADAAAILLAMTADDDPTEAGAALNWQHGRELVRLVAEAVNDDLAATVCGS